MKACRKYVAGFVALAAFGWLSLPVAAEEQQDAALAATADMSVLSAYVWRGQVLNDEAVLHPALTVSKGGFSLSTWGNWELTDRVTGHTDRFSEIDLCASYSCSLGPVGVEGGVAEYTYPDTASESTRELHLSVSLDTFSDVAVNGFVQKVGLVPSLTVNYDVQQANGYFLSADLLGEATMGDRYTASVYGNIGYGSAAYDEFYFGLDRSAFNHLTVGTALAIAVTTDLSVKPAVEYATLLDDDLRDAAKGLYFDTALIVGSLTVSYTF